MDTETSTPRQDQEGEESQRPPREPPRHALSNNWRVRGSAPSSDTGDSKPGTNTNTNPRFGSSEWRNSPGRGGGWRGRESQRDQGAASTSTSSPRRWRDGGDRPAAPSQQAASSGSLVEENAALAEGRRIYLGNILYHVRPEQITEALQENGFGDEVDQIHISVDPVTGRNPGYCFVEFETRDAAESALERMVGVLILGRPLKTGPCKPKVNSRTAGRDQYQQRGGGQYRPTFERWGNWNSDGGRGVQLSGQGPVGAEEHLIDVVQHDQRYRVFVGGLGKMINQEENDRELRAIFEGFRIAAVSKRITPSEVTRAKPGKHHYAFVDLEDEKEALSAIDALNGKTWHGSRLKVRVPIDLPNKIAERGTRYQWNAPKGSDNLD